MVQFVLFVFCLFVILFISRFGFKSRICLLIAPVPVHCFSITCIMLTNCTEVLVLILFILVNVTIANCIWVRSVSGEDVLSLLEIAEK